VKDKATFFINLENPDIVHLLDEHPYKLFEITGIDSKTSQIIFVDEVQYLQNPSNFLKLIYDDFHEHIKLVVSGSSSFYIDQKFTDSLMGRKEYYEILTLNFEEFLVFREEEQIKQVLFEDKKIPIGYKRRIEELFLEYITYGGYPEVVLTPEIEKKKRKLELLASDYIKKDIYDANISESTVFFNILKVLATQTGALLNVQTLASMFGVSQPTVNKYLYIMQKSYSIGISKPFWTNIVAELTKMPKVYFFDLGMRNTLLRNFDTIKERLDK
jgi:predicted AAA+ superfamily ATPase